MARANGRLILAALLLAGMTMMGVPIAPASAGTYQPDGSYTGTPSPAVTALFAAYPNGGDGLINEIRSLLIANPGLSDDVAYLASRGTPGQQADAGAGMAQAYIALNNGGNVNGAARIVTAAQLSRNMTLQTAVATAVGRSAVFADQSANPVTGKTSCDTVSASVPPKC